jgi:ubiquinone biosynthesis UbiH/UbiF/VisC/COQ6 family hydroxylase
MNARVIPMRVDVAVVGRGAIGMASALALAREGRSVALIGPEPPQSRLSPGQDNRVFALSARSRSVLEPLGVWAALPPERLEAVTDMRVHPSGATRERSLDFSAYAAGVDALAWIVENGALSQALSQALGFSPVRLVEGTLAALTAGPRDAYARVLLDDGRSLEARLVIGADGAQSAVRERAGIAADWRDYPQRAVVANFDCTRPHRGIAWQWFGSHGVLALLPLPAGAGSGGRFSIVWSAPLALAEQLCNASPQALAERVEAMSDRVAGAMALISRVDSYPLRIGRMAALIGPRVALVGDAAHGVHPLAGQGMNLGFGDLFDLLGALRGAEDPGERLTLRRYERSRAEPVLTMQTLTDGLQKIFDPDTLAAWSPLDRPIQWARDLGWDVVARSSLLKRLLSARALGG